MGYNIYFKNVFLFIDTIKNRVRLSTIINAKEQIVT